MQSSLFTLPIAEQLSPFCSLRQQGELTLLIIEHPEFRAAFSLQGGQLIAWQPLNQPAVIWLSDRTAFTQGKAIRGGVPICWPWFGPAGKPSHGFARTSLWQLDHYEESAQQVNVTMNLRDSAETRAMWPHEFSLTLLAELSAKSCQLSLKVEGDFESTAALHSYFHVGDSEAVKVSGLGNNYIDKVKDNALGSQQGEQTYHGEVDRIFTHPTAESTLQDPQLKRLLNIRHQGHSDVVTWNPGQTLSQSMADMSDEGYKTMVCVETARIGQPLVTTPSSPAELTVTITPLPL